jgi:hypothetical protein
MESSAKAMESCSALLTDLHTHLHKLEWNVTINFSLDFTAGHEQNFSWLNQTSHSNI